MVLKCDADHPCPEGLACLESSICGQVAGADLGSAGGEMASGYGCTVPNGKAIGRAFACPVAALSKNQAAGLCAAGFKLCTSGADVMADPLCKTISGFFAAELIGTTTGSPDTAKCQDATMPYQVFYGCGRIQLNSIYQVTAPCAQLERAVDCNNSGTGWACGRTLADTSTTVAAGVLCCPQ